MLPGAWHSGMGSGLSSLCLGSHGPRGASSPWRHALRVRGVQDPGAALQAPSLPRYHPLRQLSTQREAGTPRWPRRSE